MRFDLGRDFTQLCRCFSGEMAAVEKNALVAETPDDAGVEKQWVPKETFEPPPLPRAVMTYIGYLILYAVSLVGDFLRRVGLKTTGHVEVTKKEVPGIMC